MLPIQKLLFGIFSVTLCVFSLFCFLFTLSIFKAKLLAPWSCTRKGKRDHTYNLMLVHKIFLFFIFFLSSLQPSSAGWLLIKVDNKSWCLINFYLLKNDWTAPRLKHFYLLNLKLQTTSFHNVIFILLIMLIRCPYCENAVLKFYAAEMDRSCLVTGLPPHSLINSHWMDGT